MESRGKRRSWSNMEERALIELLKELVTKGWKNEYGFKPGYLNKLEAKLIKKLPSTDIRANPHINSKITIWKKQRAMLREIGVGFNHTTKLIDCNNDAWEKVVKEHPNAVNMRYKSWPYLNDWNEVFGKDLATEETAVDVIDTSNGLINEDRSRANVGDAAELALDDACEMDVNSQAPDVEKANESLSSGKKRAAVDGNPDNNLCELNDSRSSGNKRAAVDGHQNDNLCELLGQFSRSLEQRMDEIVRGIGYEADLGKARKEVFGMLGEIPDISMDEKLDISHMLARNTDCLEMFIGLPDDARVRYVRRLLAGDFGSLL